jgi:DNA helicase-2/ATP-dependent DNA helicase PcrA
MDSNSIFENIMNYSSSDNKPKPKAKKSDLMIEKLKSMGFNMSQLEDVIRVKGNQLIISIAGSGKTTGLIFKISFDITTGEATKVVTVNGNEIRVLDRIWVCTFLKSGADELKSKLSLWQRKLGLMDTSDSMAFSTLHAEFKRALTALGVTTNIIDSSVNSKNLKKVAEKYAIEYDGKPLNSDMLRDLESAFTYTRNRLDEKRYNRSIYRELDIGPTIIDAMLREWKSMRISLGCVDFEDLQELLYTECIVKNNIDVINFLRNRYNYIYVDEFQDTSQIQYALLKIYASGAKKIVAIGDDDQTIYSWRGSYNKIITDEFAKDFNPTISNLSVNYRCPNIILDAIKPSLEKNENRFKKELKSFNTGGSFRVGAYSSYKGMVECLSDMIYEDVKANKSVAVLCRVNSDGLLPALMLDRLGKFQYTISGDGMTLDSYIGRSVINIAKLFTEKSSLAVKNTLSMLTWNKYSINNIMKVCKNNKVSFWEIPDKDLGYSCPDIAEKLKMWKQWRKAFGDIEALRMIYYYFRTEVFVKDNQYNTVCKSVISSIETMLSISKADNVEDFLEELDSINERLKARKKKFNGSKVRIATVHEFKGKEADSVYVWNDSVDIFPHKDCDLEDEEELEEERRVHYIACTRARKINTILYVKNKPGMFLQEMDLSNAENISKVEKIGGGLKQPKPSKYMSIEDLFEDEDYVLPSSNSTTEVSPSDYTEILKMHKDKGMSAEEIFGYFEEYGYDLYSFSQIEEIVNDYKREVNLRGK